jgi:Zn-dependent peptidase ImmA (M78 family)
VLSRDKIEKIECMTWDLLLDVYGKVNVIPPIDLNRLVENAGLTIKQGVFQNNDISGIYVRNEGIIYLNENHAYVRKAFTVAHELGHFYLHQEKTNETFKRENMEMLDDETMEQEREANWFAASILMPRTIVKRLWNAIQDVEEVARRCAVSSLAAHYRLKNLGIIK